MPRKPQPPAEKWFFVSHHKTGTVLLQELYRSLANLFSPRLRTEMRYLDGVESTPDWSKQIFMYTRFTGSAWRRQFAETSHPFRMVHLVREPQELCISGYWYHLRSWDTQFLGRDCTKHACVNPDVLSRLSLDAGLERNAEAALRNHERREVAL